MTTLLIPSIDHSVMYENDYLSDTPIRQLAMYGNSYLILTLVKSPPDRSTWSTVPYVAPQSILRTSRLVRPYVNERARNKSITRGRSDGYHMSRSRSLHSGIAGWLDRSTTYPQIFNQDLIWPWMIHTACLLGTSTHLTCNHVKTSRCLRTASINAVSNAVPAVLILIQIRITSYLNAAASPVFETAKFEVFRPTHARGNLPRQFSVLIHVSRFSEVSHSTSTCRRCQGHFATYLPSSWPTSTASRIGSSGIPMGISILGEYWPGGATKVLFFGPPTSDPSTLGESLLWGSSRSC